MQGFLFSRPLPADAFARLVADAQTRRAPWQLDAAGAPAPQPADEGA